MKIVVTAEIYDGTTTKKHDKTKMTYIECIKRFGININVKVDQDIPPEN